MAAKKKAAKKIPIVRRIAPNKKRGKSFAPSTSGDIPEGFQMPATAQVPNWDFEKQKILQGEVIQIKLITKKKVRVGEKKTTHLMVVREKETQKLLQVWESAALSGLFEEVKKGWDVYLRFDGYGDKVKGRMPMKLFTSAYQK